VTSKAHRGLPLSFDALSTASTGLPKTVSRASFWYPTEQLHQKAGVRLASTRGQPHSPSATATLMIRFSFSHEKSVPQFFLAVAKQPSGSPLNLAGSPPSLAHSRPVFSRTSVQAAAVGPAARWPTIFAT
jgi:hypothetical protein